MLTFARAQQEALERQAFVRYVNENYGDYIEEKAKSAISKDGRGGATMQYMAYLNADMLGMTKKEMRDNPEKAMRAAIAHSMGDIAYQEYKMYLNDSRDITDEERAQNAVTAANAAINDFLIPGLEKDSKSFIQQFMASDKYGDVFVNYNLEGAPRRYETAITRYDLGSSAYAFLDKVADSSLVLRFALNLTGEEGRLSFTKGLKSQALSENLAQGEHAMLRKELQLGASFVGLAAGIAETVAVQYTTGGLGVHPTIANATVPLWQTAKGTIREFGSGYGIKAETTMSDMIATAGYDFVTSWAGINIGNKFVDPVFASFIAPGDTAAAASLTSLFKRYVAIGASSAVVNTGVDMAIDHISYSMADAIGVSFAQSTKDMYSEVTMESLAKSFGHRLMMQAGSGIFRSLKDAAFRKRIGDPVPAWGSKEFTDREFGQYLVNKDSPIRNKVFYNMGKYVAALGYRMSPGMLNSVDAYVRLNAQHLTQEGTNNTQGLIRAILDHSKAATGVISTGTEKGDVPFEQPPSSFKEMVVAIVMLQNGAKADMVNQTMFGGNVVVNAALRTFGGVDETGIWEAAAGIQSSRVTNIARHLTGATKEMSFMVGINEKNIGRWEELLADTFWEHAKVSIDKKDMTNDESVIADLRMLISETVGIDKGNIPKNVTNNTIRDNVIRSIRHRAKEDIDTSPDPNTHVRTSKIEEKAADYANKVLVEYEKISPRWNESERYVNDTKAAKDAYLKGIYEDSSGLFTVADGKIAHEAIEGFTKEITTQLDAAYKEMELNARLSNNPIHKYNRRLKAYANKEVFQGIVTKITNQMNTAGTSDFTKLKSYSELEGAIAQAGLELIKAETDVVLRILSNQDIAPEQRTNLANFNIQTVNEVYEAVAPSLSDADRMNLNDHISRSITESLKSISDVKYKTLFAKQAESTIKTWYDTAYVSTASFKKDKNLFYDLSDVLSKMKFAQRHIGDYKDLLSGTKSEHLTPWTLARVIDASSPWSTATFSRDANGNPLEFANNIMGLTSDGKPITFTYTPDDLEDIVVEMANWAKRFDELHKAPITHENAEEKFMIHASTVVRRVLNQNIMRQFGDLEAINNVDMTDTANQNRLTVAIEDTNRQLAKLTNEPYEDKKAPEFGSIKLDTDITKHKLGGFAGHNGLDELTFEIGIRTTSKGDLSKVKAFYNNLFTVWGAPDSDVNDIQTFTNTIGTDRDRVQIPLMKAGTGFIKAVDVDKLVKDYGLLDSPETKVLFDDLVLLGLYHGHDHTAQKDIQASLISVAADQISASNPQLVKDIRRGVIRNFSNNKVTPSELDIRKEVRKNLEAIASQHLRSSSIRNRHGIKGSLEVIQAVTRATELTFEYTGRAAKVNNIGSAVGVAIDFNNVPDTADRESIMKSLREEGFIMLGPSDASLTSNFIKVPTTENMTPDDTRSMWSSFIDGIVSLQLDKGSSRALPYGVFTYYEYNTATNKIAVYTGQDAIDRQQRNATATSRPNVITGDLRMADYFDLFAELAPHIRAKLSDSNSISDMNRVMYEIMNRVPRAVDRGVKTPSTLLGSTLPPEFDHTVDEGLTRQIGDVGQDVEIKLDEIRDRYNTALQRVTTGLPETISKLSGSAYSGISSLINSSGSTDSGQELRNMVAALLVFGRTAKDALGDDSNLMYGLGSDFSGAKDALEDLIAMMLDINEGLKLSERAYQIAAKDIETIRAAEAATPPQDVLKHHLVRALNKMLDTRREARGTRWDSYESGKLEMSDNDLIRETFLIGFTNFGAATLGSAGDLSKRYTASSLRSRAKYEEVETMVRRVTQGSHIKLHIQVTPKNEISVEGDGELSSSPAMYRAMNFLYGGYYGTGNKLVNHFSNSLMKLLMHADPTLDDSTIKINIHNFKALTPLAAELLFSGSYPSYSGLQGRVGDVYDRTVETILAGDDAIRFMQEFALHSSQTAGVTTSRTNQQASINHITSVLYDNTIDLNLISRLAERDFPSGTARANALGGAIMRQGNPSAIMGITSSKSGRMYRTTKDSRDALRADTDSGNAVYFSHNITDPDLAQFNAFRNRIYTTGTHDEAGFNATVELGIKNVLDMVMHYAENDKKLDGMVSRSISDVSEVMMRQNSDPRARLNRQQLRYHTNVMLDYLAKMKHISKFTLRYDDNGNKHTRTLYFANIERSGLDTKDHGGAFLISAVRNLDYGDWFGASPEWAEWNGADFDGDQALWRPLSNTNLDKSLIRMNSGLSWDESSGDDRDKLRILARYQRYVRINQSKRISAGFTSEQADLPHSPQNEEATTVFGLNMASQANIIKPLLDALRLSVQEDHLSNIREGVSDDLRELLKNLNVQLSLDNFNTVKGAGGNLFTDHGNNRLVFVKAGKGERVFSSGALGSQEISTVVNSFSKLIGVPGRDRDFSAVVTVDQTSGKRTVYVLHNDGDFMYNDVMAAVEFDRSHDVEYLDDRRLISIVGNAMYNEVLDRELGKIEDSAKVKFYNRLTREVKSVEGARAINSDILANMRAGNADDGIIAQLSAAGSNATKNYFQIHFLRKYLGEDGKYNTNLALKEFNGALTSARIASNINITGWDNDKDIAIYSDKVGEGQLAAQGNKALAREIPEFIKKLSTSILDPEQNKTLKALQFVDAVMKNKGSQFDAEYAHEMISVIRTLPKDIASPNLSRYISILDQIEGASIADVDKLFTVGLPKAKFAEQVWNDKINVRKNGILPLFTKEQVEYENKMKGFFTGVDYINEVLNGSGISMRFNQARDIMSKALTFNMSSIRSDGAVSLDDFSHALYESMKGEPGSYGVTYDKVRSLVRDLGINVSKETVTHIESLDEEVYDHKTAVMFRRGISETMRMHQAKDKVYRTHYMVDGNGKEITAEVLMTRLVGLMNKHKINKPMIAMMRNFNSAVLDNVGVGDRLGLLLAYEGFTINKLTKLSKMFQYGIDVFIDNDSTVDALMGMGFGSPLDEKKLFNEQILSKRTLLNLPNYDVVTAGVSCI